MKRKIISISVAVCMLAAMYVPAFGAEAAKQDDKATDVKTVQAGSRAAKVKAAQAGNSFDTAGSISLNTTYNGSITENTEAEYYRFTLNSSGSVNLQGTFYMNWVHITVFDSDGNTVYTKNPRWNSTTQQISFGEVIDLTSGTYRLCIGKDGGCTGSYNFRLDYTSAGESFKETNGGSDNSLNDANSINVNTPYKGQIAANDEKDYYRFTLNSSGSINLQGTFYMNWIHITIFDTDGNTIYRENPRWNSTTQQISYNNVITLTSGSYYLCFSMDSPNTGNYNFRLDYTSAGESFKETNGGSDNDILSANPISLSRTYRGQIADNDEKDFYRFSISAPTKVQIRLSSYADLRIYLYDANGKELDDWQGSTDSTTGRWDWNKIVTLPAAGTYYFCAEERYSDSAGAYNFSISPFSTVISVGSSFKKVQDSSSFNLNARVNDDEADLTYRTSNSRVVTVGSSGQVYIEGPGTATVTVGVEGLSVKKRVKVTVLPRRAAIYNVTCGKRSLRAQWYRNDKATGYQVVIATSKKFTQNKKTATVSKNRITAKTFKKLKKNRRYYVKVRAYKTIGKTRLYGAYSPVKSIKVK